MGRIINYSCPHCGATIMHEVDENGNGAAAEFCGSCQRTVSLADLQNAAATGAASGGYAGAMNASDAMVTYIDDAESAFAYLENYFETYDWESFAYTSALSVPAVEKMVEKMLIKAAANPSTWELQFTAIATPLHKKISGLKKLEAKFFEEFVKAEDLADCFGYFDTYAKVVKKVLASGSDLVKKLESAVKFHKKYDGNASVTQAMNAQLEAIKKEIASVKEVKDYKELPGYAKAQADKQEKISQKLAEQNINAEQLYESAVSSSKSSGDVRGALASFKKIAGYKDADEYADKLNGWLKFGISDGIFIKLGKKHYVLREQAAIALNIAALGKKDKKEEAEQAVQDGVKRYEMFEIIDKKQAEKPCLQKITHFAAHFGGHLFFIKDNSDICSFDSKAPEGSAETVIISAKPGDILLDKFFVRDNKLFVQQKLDAVKDGKKGCFASLFKKNTQQVLTNNNYKLVTVDLVTNRTDTAVPEMVDIQDIYGEEIFFTKVISSENGEDKEEFYSYNYISKRTKAVLSADTEIVDVIGDKVIYFLWTPNDFNKDLHALDLKTGADKTLDKNVFEYYGTIEDMPYYYVGNDNNKTLYRIAADGSGKQEISNNANYFDRAITVRNGWIYFKTGFGTNVSLAKMSADGKKYILLCPRFKRLVEISDGYIFYLNKSNSLCCVREDGSDNTEVLDDIGNFIQVTRDAIYLLRNEIVDEEVSAFGELKQTRRNSLYKVNLEGAGLEKVAFDVSNAITDESDKNEIYLYKTDRVTFSIAVPVSKDNYETTFDTRTIKTITVYDIENKSFKDVAVFGKPDIANFEFKGGCFKKKVSKEAIVKEVPHKKTYKRSGKAQAGETANEQIAHSGSSSSVSAPVSGSSSVRNSSSSSSGGKTKRGVGITSYFSFIDFALAIVLFIVTLVTNIGRPYPSETMCVIMLVFFIGILGFDIFMLYKNNKEGGKRDIIRIITTIIAVYGLIMSIVFLSQSCDGEAYAYGYRLLNMIGLL